MKYGIDINYMNLERLESFSSKYDHFQITLPYNSSYWKLRDFLRKTSRNIILHGHFFDPFNPIQPELMKGYRSIVNEINPILMVEHLWDPSVRNSLDYFKKCKNKEIKTIVDSINKFTDYFGYPLNIENLIQTNDIINYYETLEKITFETDANITLDISHFLISYSATKNKEKEKLLKIIDSASINHLHIAGTKVVEGILTDCHKKVAPEVVSFFLSRLPEVRHCTFELSKDVKKNYLNNCIKKINQSNITNLKPYEGLRNGPRHSHFLKDFLESLDLVFSNVKSSCNGKLTSDQQTNEIFKFSLLNDPNFWFLDSLNHSETLDEVVKGLLRLYNHYLKVFSWLGLQEVGAKILVQTPTKKYEENIVAHSESLTRFLAYDRDGVSIKINFNLEIMV